MAVVGVQAEVTSSVWKLRVPAGQAVDAGDEVVVLESMKMEIPVDSPAAGTVTEVLVSAGDSVKEGDVLLLLDAS